MTELKRTTDKRIAFWDNVRFAMMTLVVVGHFADVFTYQSDVCKSIFLFIYAFHMPVLLFVSGVFYKNDRNIEKIVYYISCGFSLKIFGVVIAFLTSQKPGFNLLADGGLPWFLFVLAAYQTLMFLLRKINKAYLLAFSIILACFVGYDQSIGDFLYLSRIIIFFPFYLAGTMFKPDILLKLIKKHYRKLLPLAALILLAWFFLCFFKLKSVYILRYLFTGKNPFYEGVIEYGPLARLLCYIISLLVGGSILLLIPKSRLEFFSDLGAHTLNAYFWHYGIYVLLDEYLNIKELFAISIVGKASFLLIAILLSIVLMACRLFDYPLILIKRQCYRPRQ